MPTIVIPTALRQYAGGQDTVEVSGTNVGEAVASLVEQHPTLKGHLYDANGKLRSFVNFYLNEVDVRSLQKEATPLAATDELLLIPAIAGGAPVEKSRSAGAELGTPFRPPGETLPDLSNEEMARYSRHLNLPEVGVEGQRKLKAGSILLIGTGGLGSPLALYLGAAGVGRLGLVDFDKVDGTNLQRQILFGTKDIGRPKIEAARERVSDLNPHVKLELHETPLSSTNALEILKDYDVVIDGTDNFATRFLVNDACVLLGKPNVYGSIFRFEGQASVFHPAGGGPCYRCLYPEPPPPGLVPSCAEGGVLGVLPGIIGVIQATEGLKLLLGKGETLLGRLLLFDALKMKFRELKLRKDPECPLCGENPTIKALIDYEEFCGLNAPEPVRGEVTPAELDAELKAGKKLVVVDVREQHEWDIANLGSRGSRLIPLGQLPERMGELDKNADLVVHCKSGARSAKAVDKLAEAGFSKVRNLRGGILAWREAVDPSLTAY